MGPRTAALRLRLPPRDSDRRREALATVLRAAASGGTGALRAASRAAASGDGEAVWRAWLSPAVSGTSEHRWASPLVTELSGGPAPVPDAVVDAAWRDWLERPLPELWSLLELWDRPATETHPRRRFLSLLALGQQDGGSGTGAGAGDAGAGGSGAGAGDGSGDDGTGPGGGGGDGAGGSPDTRSSGGDETNPGSGSNLGDESSDGAGGTPGTSGSGGDGAGAEDRARWLADAAARFDHPLGERARAALPVLGGAPAVDLFCAAALDSGAADAVAYCAAHHLAPSHEVDRAVFFVRSGQFEQYRALDPDGSLLALGYRGVPAGVRPALREAMTRLGGIDVLRVLAGQRPGAESYATLGEQERAYLVQQFVERRDWPRLWRLTLTAPLAEAVLTVRAFRDWRPSDADGRQVFETLLAAAPLSVAHRLKAFAAASPTWDVPHARIRLRKMGRRMDRLTGLDFAPDGRQLAFCGTGRHAGVVDLAAMRLHRLYRPPVDPVSVAHLGSGAIVVAGAAGAGPGGGELHHCDHRGRRKLFVPPAGRHDSARVERTGAAGSFAVLASASGDGHRKWRLLTGSGDGQVTDTGVRGTSYTEPPDLTAGPGGRVAAVADAITARVADLDAAEVHRLDGSGAEAGFGPVHAAMSPYTCVRGFEDGTLHIWHEPLSRTGPPVVMRLRSRERSLLGLAWSPALNRFLAFTAQDFWYCLDVLDLPESPGAPLPERPVVETVKIGRHPFGARPLLRLAPGGDLLAFHDDTTEELHFFSLSLLGLRPVVGRPMGLMSHEDLRSLAAVLDRSALDEESRTVLTLLRVCLEHRFRDDIGITAVTRGREPLGDGRPAAGDPTDIALGPDGPG